jgi:5-methyltetrahydrofolate--homocysteine methyltransferase
MSSDTFSEGRDARIAWMKEEAKKRILLLDGSWGVMIQGFKLQEDDFRGKRFGNHPSELRATTTFLP